MSNSWLTPWTVACQVPLSVGFFSQEYWSGLPFPSPGHLPAPEIETQSSASAGGFFTSESPGKPWSCRFSSVQLLSRVRLFATPWIAARQASLSITNSRSSLRRPSSQWCHPAISSSVVPFSSCPQSFPASESFPMSQLFAWGGQSTGVSALASFLPKKPQGWSPSEWL